VAATLSASVRALGGGSGRKTNDPDADAVADAGLRGKDLKRGMARDPGRPRTRPDALLAITAHSSRAHRALLPDRGARAVIAERAGQLNDRAAPRDGQRPARPLRREAV
jgi:hypothetical protein